MVLDKALVLFSFIWKACYCKIIFIFSQLTEQPPMLYLRNSYVVGLISGFSVLVNLSIPIAML